MLCKKLFIFTLVLVAFSSCKKKEMPPCPPSMESLHGKWLVLNEGLFQHNNSSISQIDPNSGIATHTFFEVQVGRPLGDTGNDMKRYGNKIYVVVNVSSTIEVLDAKTGVSIQQISMQENGQAKQPRYIDFHNGKAFISCYDGFVDVLDTVSLTITNRIQVGSNPDHLKVAGNRLYVSNSGGLNFPNVDSTVSVVSLTSFKEIKKITVGLNPGSITVGGNGDIYVVSRGNFGSFPSRMHRIETLGDTKAEDYPFSASQLSEFGGNILIFENEGQGSLKLFDISTNTLASNDFLSLSGIVTPYKIQGNYSENLLFVMDANGYVNSGYVYIFDVSGVFIRKEHVGLVPTAVLVL